MTIKVFRAARQHGRQDDVMEIICNGAKVAVVAELSLAMFLRGLGLNPDTVAVECDGAILARETYEVLRLREGMVLEVIRFVGGGASC